MIGCNKKRKVIQHQKTLFFFVINRPITSGMTLSEGQQKHEQNYPGCNSYSYDLEDTVK